MGSFWNDQAPHTITARAATKLRKGCLSEKETSLAIMGQPYWILVANCTKRLPSASTFSPFCNPAVMAIMPSWSMPMVTERWIMTTDTVPKEVVVAGHGFSVGGMAKGAAMLAPNMATMLAVCTTDATVDEGTLQKA